MTLESVPWSKFEPGTTQLQVGSVVASVNFRYLIVISVKKLKNSTITKRQEYRNFREVEMNYCIQETTLIRSITSHICKIKLHTKLPSTSRSLK